MAAASLSGRASLGIMTAQTAPPSFDAGAPEFARSGVLNSFTTVYTGLCTGRWTPGERTWPLDLQLHARARPSSLSVAVMGSLLALGATKHDPPLIDSP